MEVDLGQLCKPCTCGRTHKISVKGIWIESGAVEKLYDMLTEGELREYTFPVIVWDDNVSDATEEILSDVEEICDENVCLSHDGLRADDRGVDILEMSLPEETDLIIAVGSGTIHELSRYVAFQRNIPYISVPTAASQDRCLAATANLIWHGVKVTRPVEAPLYVFADTDIFSKAPYRLTASGISEMVGRYISLADWKINHLVTGDYICERIVEMEMDSLRDITHHIDDISEGDQDAMEKLMYGLILSELSVQMTATDCLAAGAEHHICHFWQMGVLNEVPLEAREGELIGVASLIVRREYQRLQDLIVQHRCMVRSKKPDEQSIMMRYFGEKGLYEEIQKINTPDPDDRISSEKLYRALDEIAEILDDIPSEEKMYDMLEEGGCRRTMREIGLDDSIIGRTLTLAPYVSRQMSFLRMSKWLQEENE